MRGPLAALAAFFHRLLQHESAATIAGFAVNPITAAWYVGLDTAIAHCRDSVGNQTYEALASEGETMSTQEWWCTPTPPSTRPEPS
jgi:hypothetical protein